MGDELVLDIAGSHIERLECEIDRLRRDLRHMTLAAEAEAKEVDRLRREREKFRRGLAWYATGGAFHTARKPKWLLPIIEAAGKVSDIASNVPPT